MQERKSENMTYISKEAYIEGLEDDQVMDWLGSNLTYEFVDENWQIDICAVKNEMWELYKESCDD